MDRFQSIRDTILDQVRAYASKVSGDGRFAIQAVDNFITGNQTSIEMMLSTASTDLTPAGRETALGALSSFEDALAIRLARVQNEFIAEEQHVLVALVSAVIHGAIIVLAGM